LQIRSTFPSHTMASANRDILQTAVVGVPDDNYPSTSALSPPSTLLHSSRLPPFPAHLSDNSSLPPSPSPTLSAHSSAVLDLKQEAGLDVHPFTFKPLQLASLVDPKNLETLEGLGGVDALLRGLGTHPTHGLSTEMGMPSIHRASPDPTLQSFTLSHATDEDPPKPGIMITSPAGEPQGLQSTVTLGGGSGVGLPAAVQSSEGVYRTSIEDRQRIFGQNILPRRPIRSLLQSMWLSVKDKVLVSSK
jgi:Ca2+-transporting ATPase